MALNPIVSNNLSFLQDVLDEAEVKQQRTKSFVLNLFSHLNKKGELLTMFRDPFRLEPKVAKVQEKVAGFLTPKSEEEAQRMGLVKIGNQYVDVAGAAGTLRAVESKVVQKIAPKVFTGFKDLTTKFLEYTKGKIALSRQEIADFARRPELKKGEADLLNRLGSEVKEAKVPAQEFADFIRRDLLELKPVKVKEPQYQMTTIADRESPSGFHKEGELGGKNYEEVVFESPITTNGSSHYPNSKNYFAHARGDEVVEGGKKIWREQEIQADFFEKIQGKLANDLGLSDRLAMLKELKKTGKINETQAMELNGIYEKINAKFQKDFPDLFPFAGDRFGERIMRERIKEKAQKGYEKYRLPTGETIGKIEGFQPSAWNYVSYSERPATRGQLLWGKAVKPEELKVGLEVTQDGNSAWIITDILGDGRFKAVKKGSLISKENAIKNNLIPSMLEIDNKYYASSWAEVFDLTGKSNPQYRRYSDWGKFLKNKYGGKEVIDPQGNNWMEIDLKKEFGRLPIEAFGVLPFLPRQKENDRISSY